MLSGFELYPRWVPLAYENKKSAGSGQASKVTKKPILAKFEGLFHARTVFYHDFQQPYVRTWK